MSVISRHWKLNERRMQNCWQWAKHTRLYSELVQTEKRESVIAVGSQQMDLNLWYSPIGYSPNVILPGRVLPYVAPCSEYSPMGTPLMWYSPMWHSPMWYSPMVALPYVALRSGYSPMGTPLMWYYPVVYSPMWHFPMWYSPMVALPYVVLRSGYSPMGVEHAENDTNIRIQADSHTKGWPSLKNKTRHS